MDRFFHKQILHKFLWPFDRSQILYDLRTWNFLYQCMWSDSESTCTMYVEVSGKSHKGYRELSSYHKSCSLVKSYLALVKKSVSALFLMRRSFVSIEVCLFWNVLFPRDKNKSKINFSVSKLLSNFFVM